MVTCPARNNNQNSSSLIHYCVKKWKDREINKVLCILCLKNIRCSMEEVKKKVEEEWLITQSSINSFKPRLYSSLFFKKETCSSTFTSYHQLSLFLCLCWHGLDEAYWGNILWFEAYSVTNPYLLFK